MSARAVTATRPRAANGAGWIVALGVGALLLRTRTLVLPDTARAGALAALGLAVLAASLLVPVNAERRTRVLHPAAVLVFGLAAVGAAALAAGRPVPVAFGQWAMPLSVLAAVAEEALFRRAAFAWLAPAGALPAVLGTALLFALVHVPLYGVAAFPVDLGAGLLLSWQRWAAGTWTVPAATHAAANLLGVMMR